ncbi:histidine phosphatase family protein [Candidatus Daviesbacteria bacterium]|nr:histidine phosphatase family protein [Candidatus Daviesbacteria bacterium]
MAVKITYFVHGTSIDNENEKLSPLGIKQTKQLREQTKDKIFDVIFSSDLKRAIDTAKFAFEGRAPIILDKRLRECDYGEHNGKPTSIVEPLQEENIFHRFPDGESYEDIKIRIVDFLNFLKENYDGKAVALVAHKGPQLALDVIIKNKTWEQAFAEDWRKTKSWQPGWEYILNT